MLVAAFISDCVRQLLAAARELVHANEMRDAAFGKVLPVRLCVPRGLW